MSELWNRGNDPFDDYNNWEEWLIQQMPDEQADLICEIDDVIRANLYALFNILRKKNEESENKVVKVFYKYLYKLTFVDAFQALDCIDGYMAGCKNLEQENQRLREALDKIIRWIDCEYDPHRGLKIVKQIAQNAKADE